VKKLTVILFILISISFAQKDNISEFDFLQQLYFENTEHQFDSFLVQKLQTWLSVNPADEQSSQVIWMLANLQESTGQKYKALLNYYKLLYLFPTNKFNTDCKSRIDTLVIKFRLPDTLRSTRKEFLNITDSQQANFEFISFIYEIDSDPLATALIEEIELFCLISTNSRYNDILFLWCAHLYEKINKPYFAEAFYKQALQLYPQSTVRPQVLYHQALLYWHKLKKYELAKNKFVELINSASETGFSAEAQFYLAAMYDVSLDNSTEAKNNYLLFYQNYPVHPKISLALKRIAQINELDKNWLEARSFYQLFYETSPADSFALTALLRIETISLDRLNDYKSAAVVMLIEANHSADDEKMYRAAEIYLDKLNDKPEAKKILQRLIKDFPDSEFVDKAKKRLKE